MKKKSITMRHNCVVALFEHSWSEVDFILPVLYAFKTLQPDWDIIVVFSHRWLRYNVHVNNRTLNDQLNRIADDIVYLDPGGIAIPGVVNPGQVRLIFKDIHSREYSNSSQMLLTAFPMAKVVDYHHALTVWVYQKFNRKRNFNWWEENYSTHDVFLVDNQISAAAWFDKFFAAKLCVVGSPRLDDFWIRKLLASEEFIESREAQSVRSAKKVFLFIVRGAEEQVHGTSLGIFPLEIFDYVVRSVAAVVLDDPAHFLLIKPHPNQDPLQLQRRLEGYDDSKWMISTLHVMQLAELSDFVISVYSSCIMDALAIGKPVVEFHPKFTPHSDLFINHLGQLHSEFSLLGLSVPVRTREALADHIDDYFNNQDDRSLWQRQQAAFDRWVPRDDRAADRAARVALNLVEPDKRSHEALPGIQHAWSARADDPELFLPQGHPESDCLHLQLKRIKAVAMPVSSLFLKQMARMFGTDCFIATGTVNQHLLAAASKLFDAVHYVEAGSDLYQANEFGLLSACRNTTIYHSANILKMVLQQTTGRILFWLSTHEGAGFTNRSRTNTPALEELAVIRQAGIRDAVILINNMRYFQPVVTQTFEAVKDRKYPAVQQLLDAILDIDKGYRFFVLGDVAIAYPPERRVLVSPGVRACTLSRMFDGKNLPLDDVMAAENHIARELSGSEKNALQSLLTDYASFEETGVGAHYRLWHGLILFGAHRYIDAIDEFNRSIQLGISHWRIPWLLAQSNYHAGNMDQAGVFIDAVLGAAPDFEPALHLLNQIYPER